MGFRRTKILKRSDHVVSRKQIDKDALYVMQHLNRNGFKAYLVGGSVRDLMLGRQPKDFDISTDAEPQQIKRLFRNCFLVGRRFRLAHIRFGRDKVIETSTFRRPPESTPEEGNLVQWDDNQFGTPLEDAFRRDFTINGMFYDLHDFSVIDHVGGLGDLRRCLIRTIGDPNIRFREDPVRMVRAVRFAGRLGFRLESRTRRAILKHAPELVLASPARLLEELYKLFGFGASSASFRALWETGLMAVLLPELHAYVKESGGKKSPLWALLAALDEGVYWNEEGLPQSLMLSVLLHAPMLAAVAKQGSDAPVVSTLQDWLEPVAVRLRMPKGLRYRILRLAENQVRLAGYEKNAGKGRRHRSPTRMLEHGSFPETLALLQMRGAAGTVDAETVAYWTELAAQHTVSEPVPEPSSTDADATPVRRRRRRRRRKPTHEA